MALPSMLLAATPDAPADAEAPLPPDAAAAVPQSSPCRQSSPTGRSRSAMASRSTSACTDAATAVRLRVARHPTISLLDFTDRKSTRLNSSHVRISYAVFCL